MINWFIFVTAETTFTILLRIIHLRFDTIGPIIIPSFLDVNPFSYFIE